MRIIKHGLKHVPHLILLTTLSHLYNLFVCWDGILDIKVGLGGSIFWKFVKKENKIII